MSIEKAIEILTALIASRPKALWPDLSNAVALSVEALKARLTFAAEHGPSCLTLLPGEIPEIEALVQGSSDVSGA